MPSQIAHRFKPIVLVSSFEWISTAIIKASSVSRIIQIGSNIETVNLLCMSARPPPLLADRSKKRFRKNKPRRCRHPQFRAESDLEGSLQGIAFSLMTSFSEWKVGALDNYREFFLDEPSIFRPAHFEKALVSLWDLILWKLVHCERIRAVVWRAIIRSRKQTFLSGFTWNTLFSLSISTFANIFKITRYNKLFTISPKRNRCLKFKPNVFYDARAVFSF